MQIELAELQRRVHSRLRTPLPQRHESEVAARIARGERLVDFDDLLDRVVRFPAGFPADGRHPAIEPA